MRVIGFIAVFAMWATSVFSQAADAIEDVIGQQLDAFNARDIDDAWQFAAPNIQSMFRNPQNFGMMVQLGYPMVWTNRDVQFLNLEDMGAVQVQRLSLQDQSGGIHVLEYQMIMTADGWRIAGVSLLPAPDVGV